ncbi:MAG: ABC transporter ATP-binding protein [Clostridiales bacterium]|nr:ABC transporter ATP-binding protein [Clostridiales bacterium]
MKEILKVKDLCFDYSDTSVLRDVNFTVNKGDFLGIIGSNGAGKSTLMKLILGLLPLERGSIELFGTDIKTGIDHAKIGYVPQRAASFNAAFPATVEEVVTANLYSRRHLMRPFRAADKKRAREVIEQVGMGGSENRLIGRLSGGQQQRVFIARALVSAPELILMDEPTVGIDAQSVCEINELIKKLNNDGLTIIMTNHDTPALVEAASRLLIFCSHGNGELVNRNELTLEQINQLYAGKRGHHHA